jgi:hypothetical protein
METESPGPDKSLPSPIFTSSTGREPTMSLMLETRPITQEQLAKEVEGIYEGLVIVEKKCVEIDQQQSSTTDQLSNEQWQALIALHRTLLHEYHDFFLASQHPSASPALRNMASERDMPARMWKYGIHSFLELLRRQLPDSLDHMLAFVYLAYSMTALLMESVPCFEGIWMQRLGDLSLYRMDIGTDLRDRGIWAGVAQNWYIKAADKFPNANKIQHHFTIHSSGALETSTASLAVSSTCICGCRGKDLVGQAETPSNELSTCVYDYRGRDSLDGDVFSCYISSGLCRACT